MKKAIKGLLLGLVVLTATTLSTTASAEMFQCTKGAMSTNPLGIINKIEELEFREQVSVINENFDSTVAMTGPNMERKLNFPPMSVSGDASITVSGNLSLVRSTNDGQIVFTLLTFDREVFASKTAPLPVQVLVLIGCTNLGQSI